MIEEVKKGWVNSRFHLEIIEGEKKRVCSSPGCSKQYSAQTSHLNLRNHWRVQHNISDSNMVQTCRYRFHPQDHIDLLVRFVVKGRHTYKIVEQKEFLQFTRSLDPSKKLITRKVLSNLVNENSIQLTNLVKEELNKTHHIALTTDIWSARKRSKGFSVITGHYLDQNMTMRNVILAFQHLPYPHDSAAIRKFLIETIKQFNIEHKLISITSDNDSANISGIGSLIDELNHRLNLQGAAQIVHIRCMAHIINLAVKEALKQLKSFLSPIEELILTVTSSTKRMERFAQIQQQMDEENTDTNWISPREHLKLIQDVDTRWNSKFISLERALLLKDAVDKSLFEMVELIHIETIDWTAIKKLVVFLKPFHEMTEKLSSENYCSMSLISSTVPILITHAESFTSDMEIGLAATSLIQKLYSYSQSLNNNVALIAAVLDPRIKTSFMVREESAVTRLKDSMKERMKMLNLDIEESTQIDQANSSSRSIFDSVFIQTCPDEIDSYFASAREASQVNILDYWRTNAVAYPKLFKLAQNTLSIQPTSVPSERSFSLAGLIDLPTRNRLSSESFRSNMLLSSWLDYLDL